MTQLQLIKPARKPRAKPVINWHPPEQKIAANVILGDRERWGPGLVQWAEMYLARLKREKG